MRNILLIMVSVLLNASAQILMRKGMMCIGEISTALSLSKVLPQMATNIYLWLSMLCYGVCIIVWMIVLSRVEVSFAYAFSSLGYIFVIIMSMLILREHIPIMRIVGISIVCIGIILVAKS